ncbi:hypothetical protein BD830_105275 [Maritimibacter alkaliphilus HTCC2654]|uniref:Uncharacterized protein n=1 Tax=Maritimibacter alkaliphilus HTCC2654 TaxID=314271 RepID=A3VKZ8_9RHOB|nr:hypothetical protein [Maritimibacter alkaliphilus]EAQ11048.1 hypothetical protein RB2654_05170 [Rhodobacterales bacterium HTCC2654] [Maritimibacter alkaliphilus HTCC2654]TYP81607.1 hypothetical protein BD830_105275 [Maritimibacter alkaliphilus HTCC2654]
MQLSDVIFYGLGAAVVVGVSGLVDFSGLFGGKSEDGATPGEADTHKAEAEQVNPIQNEYQSTLAFFLDEEHENLVSGRDDDSGDTELAQTEASEQVAESDLAHADDTGFDDDNIFGDVIATAEDSLYEAAEEARMTAPIAVYDLTDPEADMPHWDDFDPQAEMVRIEYLPTFDPETGEPVEPLVSVTYDPDFDQTTIALDDAAVAELDGDAGIGAEDIDLVPMSDETYAAA